MKSYKIAFFAYAHNLAETTRGIEVARHFKSSGAVIRFYSHGGIHESRITDAGFDYTVLEPRITEDHHRRFLDIDQGRTRGELFTSAEWIEFARAEIKALEDFKPDLIYAGFNMPCVLSARYLHVPLVSLIPTQGIKEYYVHRLGVFPEFLENVFTGLIPQKIKKSIFNFLMTRINYQPLTEINKAAYKLGISPLLTSFELISGDLVLLSDLPEITGLSQALLPENHFYIGPLFADLPMKVPEEVNEVFSNPGLKIYCAMGSSGSPDVMRCAIQSLKETSYNVVAATTSIVDPIEFAPFNQRFFVTRYVPAAAVNAMADIAVTHGGQGTLQNSIMAGKPVIGTAFQFEQQSNLEMLQRAGAAINIPLKKFNSKRLLKEIQRMSASPSYLKAAEKLKTVMETQNGAKNAADIMLNFLAERKAS